MLDDVWHSHQFHTSVPFLPWCCQAVEVSEGVEGSVWTSEVVAGAAEEVAVGGVAAAGARLSADA
jgi:hypothetical protein